MKDPKRRPRPRPKLMSQEEQAALKERQEAGRQGAIAFHHGKASEACPNVEGNPLRQVWLDGFEQASKRRLRADMSLNCAKGWNAFRDGLQPEDCPIEGRTPERAEWRAGWEDARQAKETYDAEHYR
jgi:ribosome modulation factor